MSNIKNKSTLYAVMRQTYIGGQSRDVLCALAKTDEKAEQLRGEFEQDMLDSGVDGDTFYFYTTGQIFYDA